MKFYQILYTSLILILVSPAFAAEKLDYIEVNSRSNICAENTAECRALAREIAKKDITELITKERRELGSTSFLCPSSNPQCCPPHLQPVCSNYQNELVAGARAQLKLMISAESKPVSQASQDCPFSSSFCTPKCSGEFLKVWGCAADLSDVIYIPEPWPACDKGERNNSKGICVPKPCYFRNTLIQVPCDILDQGDNVLANSAEPATPTPILIKNLNNKKIRLEAAEQVREDLLSAMNSVEKQIERLSN